MNFVWIFIFNLITLFMKQEPRAIFHLDNLRNGDVIIYRNADNINDTSISDIYVGELIVHHKKVKFK